MANQWLTGAGVPALGTGTVTDYYRDTASNLVYYRENAFTWTVVPAFTPNPDGIGTTWLHGNVPPLTGQGSDGDYYYDEVQLIVYRKDGATWVPKGSLDFIGIYGVQWGNGIGAPASTVPLNALPAGSFYLNVETSDIYYKEPSMAWVLKGQLGDGGGGSSEPLITTMLGITPLDTTHATAASAVYELATYLGGLIPPPATPESIGADPAGSAAAAEASAKSYANVLVSSVWKDQGNFGASSGAWPTSVNVAGGGGNILAGYLWKVTTGGTLTGGVVVDTGDILRALVNSPTNSATDWAVTEGNDGYVAENAASKAVNFSIKNDTLYPSTKAVDDNYVAISALRYVINQPTLVANAYTVLSTDVSAYGNKILKVVNTVATTITLPNPNALSPAAVVGDSFNIRQGGAGGITITGSITGVNTTSVQHTTLTLIAESPTSWMSVGG